MKKIFRYQIIVFILSFILCGYCAAIQDEQKDIELAQIKATVDQSTITIGDKIIYTLSVITNDDVKVSFPMDPSNFGGFMVQDFGENKPQRAGSHKIKHELWYTLDTYTVGSYVIPPHQAKITFASGKDKELLSPEIFVEVKSVLGVEQEKEDIHEIKEPKLYSNKYSFWFLMILLSIILICVLCLASAIYYFKKNKNRKTLPARLPHEIALDELLRIEEMDLLTKGKIKEYYYRVSSCLRHYLEGRYSLRAPEQTTEEFIEEASKTSALSLEQKQLLEQYLSHCDLVKYAKLEPFSEEAHKLLQSTRQFIENTKALEIQDEKVLTQGLLSAQDAQLSKQGDRK
ncbi:MAG: hypothetical protein Q8Q33_09335 [Chlamydiota bacterium]|nr:hypothetical protein [Chlamydiota bacterium]